jgi:N-acetylmuramoyl-L-alanine amidase
LHPEWTVPYKNGNLYFDPGIPAAREWIVNGVAEIVRRYSVDGIHYDDYFYPNPDFPDQASYAAYGAGADRGDWRRGNINSLIQSTQNAVRAASEGKSLKPRFGVSPFGIWLNAASSPEGSQTNGSESYIQHYADTRKWVQNQWLDYICPQIYWNIGYEIADYGRLLQWWADAVQDTGVALYVGMAAYRAGSGGSDSQAPWYGTAEITRQLELNAQYPQVRGHIMYRYQSFASNAALSGAVRDAYRNSRVRPAAMPVSMPVFTASDPSGVLTVGRPAQNITTGQGKYFMLGASDPGKPLFINGQEIFTRTWQGYFSSYVTLNKGENVFVLTQEGQNPVTRVITRSNGGGGGGASSQPPGIEEIPRERRLYAQVTAPYAYVYSGASTSGGPQGELIQGQTDYVTARTDDGKWVRLGLGFWIQTDNAAVYEDAAPFVNVLSDPVYTQTSKWDAVTWKTTRNTATAITYGDAHLIVDIQGAAGGAEPPAESGSPASAGTAAVAGGAEPPAVTLPLQSADTLFASAAVSDAGGKARYDFTLNWGQRLEGYYITATSETLTLHLKKTLRAAPSDSSKPLLGVVILLDPGHGGSDAGALGPLGETLPEDTINLFTALKVKVELENLGAAVHMTRTEDQYVSLEERVQMSRALLPDLFISIHANSMDESVDAEGIYGVSTWYREAVSKDFAEFMYQYLWNSLSRSQKGSHQSNLYVCRPSWAPSVIIETGFMCNPSEYAWLTDNLQQNELAYRIARAVAAYCAQV